MSSREAGVSRRGRTVRRPVLRWATSLPKGSDGGCPAPPRNQTNPATLFYGVGPTH